MKVINVISDTNIGGAGKCIVNFANNIKDKNIDLYVVLPENSLLIPYFKKNVKLIKINGLKDKSFDIKSFFKLRKIFKEIKPDIVHTHSAIIARIVAKLTTRAKIIYTKHCYYDLKKKEHNFFRKKLYGLFDKIFADRIIIVSDALRENLVSKGSISSKMDTIQNGVQAVKKLTVQEKTKIRKKYNIKRNDFVVSIIARLVPEKDHETFIQIAQKFKENNITDIKFLIVGDGELLFNLKKKVKNLELDNMVIFTGFIKNIEKILNITDLQVNCSIGTETCSLSIIEGFSIGLPTVATNFGGNPTLVTDDINGYLVKIKNVEEFYERVYAIKNDKKLYKKLSNGALKTYNNKFDIEKYVSNIEQEYYKVVSR